MTAILLLLLPLAVLGADFPSVYLPIGVGYTQKDRDVNTPFGVFPKEFLKCGSGNTDQLNVLFSGNGVPSSIQYLTYCEPVTTQILVPTTHHDFGDLKKDLLQECEALVCTDKPYPAKGTKLGVLLPKERGDGTGEELAPQPEDAKYNVCEDRMARIEKVATTALIANENTCANKHPTIMQAVSVENSPFYQAPRWLKATESRFDLRTAFYSGDDNNRFAVPYGFDVPTQLPAGFAFHKCDGTCDKGTIIKYTMAANAYSFMIYLQDSCPAFRVCFGSKQHKDDAVVPTCSADYTFDVLVENGVVVWGKMGRASVIRMKSAQHHSPYVVPIEFGYGVEKGGQVIAEFYVGNDHRETVATDTKGYLKEEAQKVIFFFPKPDCLMPHAGIYSKNIESGTGLADAPYTIAINAGGTAGAVITGKQEMEATTPAPDDVPVFVSTTTPASMQVVPAAIGEFAAGTAEGNKALYVSGKWWTWGMFVGFVIGTLVTILAGGGIFYVLRRTVYGIWYRGMFKRYGCDVSGTTGGITGVGFDSTMTKDETVLGGTTGGGTTGGTSTSSTIGGTTGGGGTTGATGTSTMS